MCIDFRRNPSAVSPVVLGNQAVELVQQYKYLGTVIDTKLCFEPQADGVCKKAHQQMHFLHKLRSFSVDTVFMKCFIPVLLNLFLPSLLFGGTGHSLLNKKKKNGNKVL